MYSISPPPFFQAILQTQANTERKGMAVGELLGPSTFVCVMTGKWFIYYGSWHIKAALLMKLHPSFMLCSLNHGIQRNELLLCPF